MVPWHLEVGGRAGPGEHLVGCVMRLEVPVAAENERGLAGKLERALRT